MIKLKITNMNIVTLLFYSSLAKLGLDAFEKCISYIPKEKMKKYYKEIFPLFKNYLINIKESKDAELDDYISNSKMKMMKVIKKIKTFKMFTIFNDLKIV